MLMENLQSCSELKKLLQEMTNVQLQKQITEIPYQQYQNEIIRKDKINFLETIILLSQKGDSTKYLNHIIQKKDLFFSCLLAYCTQVVEVFDAAELFTISHKNFTSQSVLLALFLAKQRNEKVDLVIAQDALARSGHLIAGDAQEDKITFTKSVLQKEGVIIHDLSQWNKEGCDLISKIVILDVFGVNSIDYTPFLIKNSQKLFEKKTFVYHSHLQDEEVTHLLERAGGSSFPLQIWPKHPVQHLYKKQEKEVITNLLQFLKEDAKHPEKQDIIIFYLPEQHVKLFSSRLLEQFSIGGVREQISLITKPHLKHQSSKNNIFIVDSFSKLLQWNYDYSNVLCVIDYGYEYHFVYDYRLQSYKQSICHSSQLQKSKRMSLIGNNYFGIYYYLEEQTVHLSNVEVLKQLGCSLLKLIDYGLFQYIDKNQPRIIRCLETLQRMKVINVDKQSYHIIDQSSIYFAKHGINPLFNRLIQDILGDDKLADKEKEKIANLALYTIVVLQTTQSLRQFKQDHKYIKLSQIWKKSGYLQSCLEIFSRCDLEEIIKTKEYKQSQTFRRVSSIIETAEDQFFGSLYQLIEDYQEDNSPIQFNQATYIYHNSINEDVFYKIREQIEDYRHLFKINKTAIIFEQEDLYQIIQRYVQLFSQTVYKHSQDKRKGYISMKLPEKTKVLLSQSAKIGKINENVKFLIAFRFKQIHEKLTIQYFNPIPEINYLTIFGELPINHSESISEIEVEFHGISTSAFERLWKNNGIQITKFETENDCFVEPNMEMAQITVHCSKEKADKIREQFQAVLAKIRQKLSVSSQLVHYFGNTNLILGAGGAVKQIVKSDYINKCLLGNLHLEVTREDLEELFEDFIATKDITIHEAQPGKQSKSAVIHFHSQKDYYKFYDIFQECNFYDHLMDVKPIRDQETTSFAKPQQYIDFQWFVWKSHNKALVRFATSEEAKKALLAFDTNPLLDGAKVKVALEDRNLTLEELSTTTDEIYIEEALKVYGKIKEVEILKTPLKEISNEDILLQQLIKNCIYPQNENIKFQMQPVKKGKNGLRSCKVHFQSYNCIMIATTTLNNSLDRIGEARLYAYPTFEKTLFIPKSLKNLALAILEETIQNLNLQILNRRLQVEYMCLGQNLLFRSGVKGTLDTVCNKLTYLLQGKNATLGKAQKVLVYNEIGIANFLDLEEKYHCKLVLDISTQTLKIISKQIHFKQINNEINERISQKFFYKAYLNKKSYLYFQNVPERLDQIRKKYHIDLIQLQIGSYSLILQGRIDRVQQTLQYLMHLSQSFVKSEEQRINTDLCGICCEDPKKVYRLQKCFHIFCKLCLAQYIKSVLGDASQFPIKCPHCAEQLLINDIEYIIQKAMWDKIKNIAINKYISQNSSKISFCFTAGCKEINFIDGPVWNCNVCHFSYCNLCREVLHPGYTCEQSIQIKQTDQYFKKYMFENGVRQCPNKDCRMPVSKIDGCNKVLCTRCGKSMCFKCLPEQMVAYETPNDAYQHLTKVHGGYY